MEEIGRMGGRRVSGGGEVGVSKREKKGGRGWGEE